ncbi:MAG: ABC transporter substrate-binding protein [Gemmatimonadota bacterium]|nr:MAG: ABC transporter substrate-binding protein [Gemmatimonadota bacterium]
MLMRYVRTRASLSGLAAFILAAAACGDSGSSDTVRFGVAAPLEQFIGSHTLRGAELARDQLNAAGGIEGRAIELVALTDSASTRLAVAVADRLYSDATVLAVVGHVNSGATLAAAPIYNRGLPIVSPVATSPEISRAGEWIFRVCSSDVVNAAGLAEFALRELGMRAAIIYANDPYGRGLREGFGRTYTAGGGALVEEYPFIEGSTTDFEAYLMGIRAAGPDLIFIGSTDIGAEPVIRQAREMGIDAPFVGGDGILGLAGRGSAFEGTYIGLLYHPDAPGGGGEEFVDAYQTRYREPPDHFAALGYDALMLLAEAASEVGLNRTRIRDYLEQVGRERGEFSGVSGRIAFDENGDPIGKSFAVGRVSGDAIEFVSVEGGS